MMLGAGAPSVVHRLTSVFRCTAIARATPATVCDYIGSVERGETNISLDNLERIARALKVSVARLFAEADQVR
jgi:hypothetical protein